MKVVNHLLVLDDGAPIPFAKSPNIGSALKAPQYLVMHYTAGRGADSSARTLTDPASKASAHLVIGRDGSIIQLVPFNTVAWHAGQSRWRGLTGLNSYSIGIELDNAGELTQQGAGWRSWFGAVYPSDDVLVAVHKHGGPKSGWHVYPTAQMDAAVAACRAIVDFYKLIDVIGHEDIAPERKRDPGPAFPMFSFRAAVAGRGQDEAELYETTARVNVRMGPGINFAKAQEQPLDLGSKLALHSSDGSWCYVDVLAADNSVRLNGWIYGDYIKRI